MSLLMKALEKAAKDRGDTQQAPPNAASEPAATRSAAATPGTAPLPPAAAKAPAAELSLEPLASKSSPSAPAKPAASSTGKSTGNSTATDNDRDQARAATVLQATATAAGPRIRPVMAFGIVAGLVALGLAVYVYLQITNPAMFIRQPPAQPRPPAPLAQAPAPAQPPITTSAVVAPAAPAAVSGTAAPAPREAEPRRAPRPAPAPQASAADATRDSIRISAGTADAQLNPLLPQAYAALQSGKLAAARQLYADAARSEPRNINALLGLAAIAMQEDKADDASRLYFNVLELEPRNAYAQTGLIALMGRADPAAAETRLKQLIAREPLPSLYFTLGNLYGDQSRWAEAQQAYFKAHQLEPGNPDYAYNLAVGLEHVGQSKLAAGFYQRAVSQAQAKGRSGFNLAQAQDRIRQLASRPD